MMQTGIFSGYFPYGLEETARKIRALDFNTVQLDMHFKDMELSAGQITKEKCIRIREAFRDNNLPISCISGYTNIIHPDKAERERRVGYLKEIISHAQYLGTPYVNNVVGSVEETVKMFAQVDHPGLGLLMDPTNYFETHNIDRMDDILNQVFDTLSDKIKIAHAKDVKRSGDDKTEKHADIGDEDALESHTFRGVGEIELPAPGLGSLNYDLYLRRLAKKHPNVPMIIEHLDESDVPRAKKFLDGKLRALGL
ncbi:sugar phosphate isomerase/epimerase family protein [Sinorhizobium medicae]